MFGRGVSAVFFFIRSISRYHVNLICNNKLVSVAAKCYSTANSKTYYSVLGLKPDATEDEIKKAYYSLSKKYHPDLNLGDKSAESKILEVNEAFEVLGSKIEKEKYDSKVFPKIWEKNSFIYDQEKEEPEIPSYTYRRVFKNAPRSYEQYFKHVKGVEKRKQRHSQQKCRFHKSQNSQKVSKSCSKYW